MRLSPFSRHLPEKCVEITFKKLEKRARVEQKRQKNVRKHLKKVRKMCNNTLKRAEKCVNVESDTGKRTVISLKRKAIQDLVRWKASEDRKPLVLKGARQVGKTWLMKEFGGNYYDRFVYFNFDEEDELKSVFETNKNPQRIIELLSMLSGERIVPGETLIIFDEIQECPEALNALKYFKEKANEYHVIAAGSLLGTLLARPKSYPVGMVNLLDIYPMCFDEFLDAADPTLFAYYESIEKEQQIEEIFHNRLMDAYNNYLIIGGMPECVSSWIKYKDPARVSQIQKELIEIYENDFSKHNGKVNSGRILMVFRSIVSQLAKPNEKFMYGAVREGG